MSTLPHTPIHFLRRADDFRRVLRRGRVIDSAHWRLYHAPGRARHPRFGVAVNKSLVKTAVQRNRLRRLWRESLRLEIAAQLPAVDCLMRLTARYPANTDNADIRAEYRRLLSPLYH